jgi:membrane protein DedA with SNARE-associated domain
MIAAALASNPPTLPGFLNAIAPVLQHYGLVAIGLLILVEDFGVPAPGETILIAGSVYAGAGHLNIVAVGVVGFIAAIIGDNIGFAIGHFGGRALALRWGKYVFLTEERLNKAEHFFDRRGAIVITFARFVEGLRQANGIIAGITGMHWLRFLIFNAIGAALWVGTWVTAGYFAGNHITTIYHYVNLYSYYLLIALGVLILGFVIRRLLRRRRRRLAAAVTSQVHEAHVIRRTSEPTEVVGATQEADGTGPGTHGPDGTAPGMAPAGAAAPDEHAAVEAAPDEHAIGKAPLGMHRAAGHRHAPDTS